MYLDLYITELKNQKYEVFCLAPSMEVTIKTELQSKHPGLNFVENLKFAETLRFKETTLRRYSAKWITLVSRNLINRYIDIFLVGIVRFFRFFKIKFRLQRGINFEVLVNHLSTLKKHDLSFDLAVCMYLDYTFLTAKTSKKLDNLDTPWVGLYFHPPKSNQKNLVARSNFQLSKSNKGFIVFSQANMNNLISKLRKDQICSVFPDITQTEIIQPSVDFPDLRDLAAGRTIVGMIGAVDGHKKMPDVFIEVSKDIDMTEFFFVLIGEFYWSSLKYLSSLKNEIKNGYSQKNLFIIDRYISSDAEYNYIFSRCDIIFACYKNFEGSANVLTKSSLFSIPLIVNSDSSLAALVDDYNLGLSISPINKDTVVDAIQRLSEKRKTHFSSFKFDSYLEITSTSAFAKTLSSYLARLFQNESKTNIN
jgi:hypothetical protein